MSNLDKELDDIFNEVFSDYDEFLSYIKRKSFDDKYSCLFDAHKASQELSYLSSNINKNNE